jgi:cytochrome c-type biogenesis protein CcmH
MPRSIIFWAIALALTVVALAFLLPGLLRSQRLSRGRRIGLALVATVPLLAVALYFLFGTPQAVSESSDLGPDLAPTTTTDYVARLESHLERQPRDARGWVLLGRAYVQADRFDAATRAFERALEVSPTRVGKDASVLTEYADALAMSQGGRLSGRPAAVIERALVLNPRHPVALDMAGSLAFEEGRYGDSAKYWRELLAILPAGSQRQRELTVALERAERRAEAAAGR